MQTHCQFDMMIFAQGLGQHSQGLFLPESQMIGRQPGVWRVDQFSIIADRATGPGTNGYLQVCRCVAREIGQIFGPGYQGSLVRFIDDQQRFLGQARRFRQPCRHRFEGIGVALKAFDEAFPKCPFGTGLMCRLCQCADQSQGLVPGIQSQPEHKMAVRDRLAAPLSQLRCLAKAGWRNDADEITQSVGHPRQRKAFTFQKATRHSRRRYLEK